MSKAKKDAKKLLAALKFEPAPLSNKKGRVIDSPESRRLTTKDRRRSGHRIIYCEDEEGNVTQFDSYDDWRNHRDSMRNKWAIKKMKRLHPQMFGARKWHDNTELDETDYLERKKEQEKIKKKEQIRRIRRIK